MNIKEDLLNQEIEHWKNFYNNYKNIKDRIIKKFKRTFKWCSNV